MGIHTQVTLSRSIEVETARRIADDLIRIF
jgi:hypothetical protein